MNFEIELTWFLKFSQNIHISPSQKDWFGYFERSSRTYLVLFWKNSRPDLWNTSPGTNLVILEKFKDQFGAYESSLRIKIWILPIQILFLFRLLCCLFEYILTTTSQGCLSPALPVSLLVLVISGIIIPKNIKNSARPVRR